MARFNSFIFFFLCSSLFPGWPVSGDEAFQEISLQRLTPSSTCTSHAGGNPNAVKIIDRHGACVGNIQGKRNPLASLTHDASRVASIHASVSGTVTGSDKAMLGSLVSLPTKSGIQIGTGDYVIKVGFGTPVKTQTVIFDTGSDVSWIQCQPCVRYCYSQQEPIFDPSQSSSYKNITCASIDCLELDVRGCATGTCVYGVAYGDGSSTIGFLATETLALTSEITIESFIFGCGENNRGIFNGSAGLIGLGRNRYSLNSQASPSFGNVFSYCLPSGDSDTGYLNFGKPVKIPEYTAMLSDSRAPSLYFIDLVGITVGGTKLDISPATFQSAGTIIDSGTVITRLPPAAYSALKTAFKAAMTEYTPAPGLSILDTCYDFSNTTSVTYPTIVLQFTGIDVKVSGSGVFYVISPSKVCLAFAGNLEGSQLGIIGNVQQRTMEVTYDNDLKKIGFAAGACS